MGISSVKFDKEKLIAVNQEIVVYDSENKELKNTINNKNIVKIEDVPNHVVNAFISIEDKDFLNIMGLIISVLQRQCLTT